MNPLPAPWAGIVAAPETKIVSADEYNLHQTVAALHHFRDAIVAGVSAPQAAPVDSPLPAAPAPVPCPFKFSDHVQMKGRQDIQAHVVKIEGETLHLRFKGRSELATSPESAWELVPAPAVSAQNDGGPAFPGNPTWKSGKSSAQLIAAAAYEQADAMLAERAKKGTP